MSKTVTLVFLAIALIMLGWGVSTYAQDDPPMELEVKSGPLPAEQNIINYATIEVGGETYQDAKYIRFNKDNTFRHYIWKSGANGCVFTADTDGVGGIIHHAGGGRSLSRNDTTAYISEGFHVYGLAGQNCSAYGVSECGGPFCR